MHMKIRRGRTLLMAAAAVTLVVPVSAASSASAVPPKVDSVPPAYVPLRSAMPKGFDTVFGNVDYNGGPVMPSNTDYMVLWSPKGLGAYGSPEYIRGIAQYFKDLAHDNGGNKNADSVATQYNDTTGAFSKYAVTFGGILLDTDPYPRSQCPVNSPVTACLTDAQIQKELEKVVAAHHLKTDLTHEYFLFSPPNVENCFTNKAPSYGGCSAGEGSLGLYCAYHENTSLSPMLIYSNDPYVTGIGGCDDGNHPNGPSDGVLVGGLSHEHNESITDPLPNDAWTNGAGAGHGQENGDQCGGQMGTPLGTAPNGAKYNQVINGHFYWYQEEWSNKGHTCLQRLTLPGRLPTAKFTATAGSGLSMSFDATGSTAPGGVSRYVWQFNDSFGDETVEVTTPKITHKFEAAGAYSVGLTIYAHDGLSIGTGAIVTTGHSGFTAGFTFSPASPTVGQNVAFSALTKVSNQPVLAYMWEFGDGSTGSGDKPKHAYTKAGTYTVTLVMFSGTGSAFPGAGAGPVVTAEITVR
jgi:hypothetical protein